MSLELNPISNDYARYKEFGIKPNEGIDWSKYKLTDRYKILLNILWDIFEGKRRHRQADFHCVVPLEGLDTLDKDQPKNSCGTAHCIAGWMSLEQAINLNEPLWEQENISVASEAIVYDEYNSDILFSGGLISKYKESPEYEAEYNKILEDQSGLTASTWLWASAVLQLTYEESTEIFSEDHEGIKDIIWNYYNVLKNRYSESKVEKIFGMNEIELKEKLNSK